MSTSLQDWNRESCFTGSVRAPGKNPNNVFTAYAQRIIPGCQFRIVVNQHGSRFAALRNHNVSNRHIIVPDILGQNVKGRGYAAGQV